MLPQKKDTDRRQTLQAAGKPQNLIVLLVLEEKVSTITIIITESLSPGTYFIRRGDDVHTDTLLRQNGFRVDTVQSGSEFCVLGQGLKDKNVIFSIFNLYFHNQTTIGSITDAFICSMGLCILLIYRLRSKTVSILKEK